VWLRNQLLRCRSDMRLRIELRLQQLLRFLLWSQVQAVRLPAQMLLQKELLLRIDLRLRKELRLRIDLLRCCS
jgi:hypothetical protein